MKILFTHLDTVPVRILHFVHLESLNYYYYAFVFGLLTPRRNWKNPGTLAEHICKDVSFFQKHHQSSAMCSHCASFLPLTLYFSPLWSSHQ